METAMLLEEMMTAEEEALVLTEVSVPDQRAVLMHVRVYIRRRLVIVLRGFIKRSPVPLKNINNSK